MPKRTLFIGDSHTCGYESFPDRSYTMWNRNNYAALYQEINDKDTLIYAESGAPFRVFVDWLKTMLTRYNDIDEVFINIPPFNRFIIAWDDLSDPETIPKDYFCWEMDPRDAKLQRFSDEIVLNNRLQLFQKPITDDYEKLPPLEFSQEDGLTKPDIRKTPFVQIKLFFEMNTYLEKRDFLNAIYTWDNICSDHGVPLYLFSFRDRMRFPTYNDYYGQLKNTVISPHTVESFFRKKNIDHSKYLLQDMDHYNEDYHTMIAELFLPWLKNQQS